MLGFFLGYFFIYQAVEVCSYSPKTLSWSEVSQFDNRKKVSSTSPAIRKLTTVRIMGTHTYCNPLGLVDGIDAEEQGR